jgi:hypothetical protein
MVERHLDPGPQARESSIRMPKRVLRPLESNPFLQNLLEGWNAPHSNVRFPVTFAVYREGPNLALYLTPSGVAPLKEALAIPPRDQAIVLDGSLFGELGKNIAMPWAAIDKLKDEVDIVHLPEGVRLEDPAVQAALARLPVPLLARPEEALPAELGSQVALAVNDGCHAAVLVREPDLLARCFQRFIEEFVVAVRLEDTALPELDRSLLGQLLAPLPEGSWYEMHLKLSPRVWTLEFELYDDEGPSDVFRWVCEGEGGRWRAGWSW